MTQSASDKKNTLPKMKNLCRIYNDLGTLPRMRYGTRNKQRNSDLNPTQRNTRRNSERKSTQMSREKTRFDNGQQLNNT